MGVNGREIHSGNKKRIVPFGLYAITQKPPFFLVCFGVGFTEKREEDSDEECDFIVKQMPYRLP